jgi:hypothetical protein
LDASLRAEYVAAGIGIASTLMMFPIYMLLGIPAAFSASMIRSASKAAAAHKSSTMLQNQDSTRIADQFDVDIGMSPKGNEARFRAGKQSATMPSSPVARADSQSDYSASARGSDDSQGAVDPIWPNKKRISYPRRAYNGNIPSGLQRRVGFAPVLPDPARIASIMMHVLYVLHTLWDWRF